MYVLCVLMTGVGIFDKPLGFGHCPFSRTSVWINDPMQWPEISYPTSLSL